ncbi:hypothetical protein ACEPAF_522 [Sanghuangporus sanghuang]
MHALKGTILPSDPTVSRTVLRCKQVYHLTGLGSHRDNDREVLEPYELPLLHTLISSLDVICSHFVETRLPSPRTVVFKRLLQNSFDIAPFFQCHGKNIESPDMSGHAGLFERRTLELLSNVRDVVMDVWDKKAIGTKRSNVRKLGICNLASSQASSLAATVYSLGSIHLQRIKGNYLNLKTIRSLDGATVRLLRERNGIATQLRERLLRNWSIRLEDGHGHLLLPTS